MLINKIYSKGLMINIEIRRRKLSIDPKMMKEKKRR